MSENLFRLYIEWNVKSRNYESCRGLCLNSVSANFKKRNTCDWGCFHIFTTQESIIFIYCTILDTIPQTDLLCFILVRECRFATYRYAYLKAWVQGAVFIALHWLKRRLLLCITFNPVIVKLITSNMYSLFHICFYLYTLEMLINFIFKSVEGVWWFVYCEM